MKDVELPLRKAYVAALKNIGVPVYYIGNVPDNISGNYVVISIPSNVDDSTKYTNDTNTTVRVKIHTQSDKGNTGFDCANIATAIFAAIYPNPQFVLKLDNEIQMCSTRINGDNTEDFKINNVIVYIDRTINFTHKLNHK